VTRISLHRISARVAISRIVLAVIGCYAGIYGIVRIRSMLTKKPVPAAKPAVATSTITVGENKYGFEFPTMENFDEWEKNEANWAAWEKFMDSGKFDEWVEGK